MKRALRVEGEVVEFDFHFAFAVGGLMQAQATGAVKRVGQHVVTDFFETAGHIILLGRVCQGR